MRYCLSQLIGDGTESSPFDAAAALYGPTWRIDLRGDVTQLAGYMLCAVDTPSLPNDSRLYDLGDLLDGVLPNKVLNSINTRLGITLAAKDLRRILPELLIQWAGAGKWKPLRPTRQGMYEIWLRDKVYSLPVVAGGTTITETFNTADSDILGPNLSWTELEGDIDVVTNEARTTGLTASAARAESALATDDHYVQADVLLSGGATGGRFVGVSARRRSDATNTYYWFALDDDLDQVRVYRVVAGTATLLANPSFIIVMGTSYLLKGQVNGSSLEVWVDSVSKATATDTNIVDNLYTEIRGRNNNAGQYARWDNFEAGDLAAAAAAQNLMMMGVGH